MKGNMKRFMAIMLCMVQLFACLPQGHGHAHAEETCTHPAESVTNYQTWKWVEGSSYTEYLNGDYHVEWM